MGYGGESAKLNGCIIALILFLFLAVIGLIAVITQG